MKRKVIRIDFYMTYNEYLKKALKAYSLDGKEREIFLSELEEDLKSIENLEEQYEAHKVLEDIKNNNMSELKNKLQELAKIGNGYAQAALPILDYCINGDDEAFAQCPNINDKNYALYRSYKEIFIGLDDINIMDKDKKEDSYIPIYLSKMGGITNDEIVPVGEKYRFEYTTLEKHKIQIAEKITKRIQKLADAAWQIGHPVNEKKLEDLIRYISIPYENTEIQNINSKNVKRIFKEFIEAFNLDTDEWVYTDIDIYSDKFKNLCKIHIYLPIEGEVTGVYFFERYYGKTRSKNASVNLLEQIMPNNNENKPQDTEENILSIEYYSSETEKEIASGLDFVNTPEKLEMIKNRDKKTWKEIKNNNGYIKDKQQKRYDSYKENFPKIYDFSLDNYPKEEVTKLGDLLNYIEYDLLVKDKNSSDANKLSKKINIFLMLKSPAIEIFEKIPSKDIAERDCFIFLKSELLRQIELYNVLVLKNYVYTTFETILRSMKSASYALIDKAVVDDVIDRKFSYNRETIKNYKKYLERLNILNFKVDNNVRIDNVFLVFLINIIIDELKFELKMRNRNSQSIVDFNCGHIALEIIDFKSLVLKEILDVPWFPLFDAYKGWKLNHRILAKYFIEKLQSKYISLISYVIILQLCKYAKTIKIRLSKSYNNTRVKTMSLEELLKSQMNSKEVKRILSYLVEKQFYYNLGYWEEYEIMNDFRVALETKACDLIKTKFDKADHIIIRKIFGEMTPQIINNIIVDFQINDKLVTCEDITLMEYL